MGLCCGRGAQARNHARREGKRGEFFHCFSCGVGVGGSHSRWGAAELLGWNCWARRAPGQKGFVPIHAITTQGPAFAGRAIGSKLLQSIPTICSQGAVSNAAAEGPKVTTHPRIAWAITYIDAH